MEYEIKNLNQLPPREFEQWWLDLKRDGADRAVFFDLPPDQRNIDFWRQFADCSCHEINMIYDRNGRKLAFFWLTGKCGLAAFLNFGFLKAGLAGKNEIGRWVLGLLWYGGYKSLGSITSAYNVFAVNYAQSLGGRVVNRWPGACHHASTGVFHDGILIQFLPGEAGITGH